MNHLQFIKQFLTNKTIVHAAMLAFAVTSTLNIAGFFMATHHHWLVAASAGLALGAGLMAVSVYLSRQEFGKGLSFWTLLVSTVAMAVLSGQIQSMAYQLHGLDGFTARLLGYAPPFVAEVLLALSVSLAERTERERAQRDSKQFIKDSVAESMTSAFRNVDASRIQKHIEKQVDSVIRAFVDDALGEMLAELNNGRQPDDTNIVQPIAPVDSNVVQPPIPTNDQDSQIEQPKAPMMTTLDLANAQRQADIEQRRQHVLNILSEHLTLGVSELHNLLGGEEVCSRGTLNNDLKALAAEEKVYNADRKWHIISAIRTDLPSVATPTTNGLNGHH
ncbi:MAG: hypothetical protein AB7L09_24730 [Nitrospira sp.]